MQFRLLCLDHHLDSFTRGLEVGARQSNKLHSKLFKPCQLSYVSTESQAHLFFRRFFPRSLPETFIDLVKNAIALLAHRDFFLRRSDERVGLFVLFLSLDNLLFEVLISLRKALHKLRNDDRQIVDARFEESPLRLFDRLIVVALVLKAKTGQLQGNPQTL